MSVSIVYWQPRLFDRILCLLRVFRQKRPGEPLLEKGPSWLGHASEFCMHPACKSHSVWILHHLRHLLKRVKIKMDLNKFAIKTTEKDDVAKHPVILGRRLSISFQLQTNFKCWLLVLFLVICFTSLKEVRRKTNRKTLLNQKPYFPNSRNMTNYFPNWSTDFNP
uniref:Uncharacterized protein n=1 Tax=Labrus bergylta TaxID=56723 RepID=A0A3Q3GR11_9LABR